MSHAALSVVTPVITPAVGQPGGYPLGLEGCTSSARMVTDRANSTWKPASVLRAAMADSDRFVVQLDYADVKGKRTRRMVSPIRFASADRFLGLCLCREQPRQFHLSRCSNFRLVAADDVIMPVEMVELDG